MDPNRTFFNESGEIVPAVDFDWESVEPPSGKPPTVDGADWLLYAMRLLTQGEPTAQQLQRRVYSLAYVLQAETVSLRDVAKICGCSVSTAKIAVDDLRAALRDSQNFLPGIERTKPEIEQQNAWNTQ